MATKFNCIIEEEIAVITFEDKDAPMNTWSAESQAEFGSLMDELAKTIKEGALKGIVIISGKGDTFLAGADLNALLKSSSEEDFYRDAGFLQEILSKLDGLDAVTVAAINGHCMGGGLELALACDARIVKDSKTTTLALPEVGLGLIPAGGGTTRLPRLIGYPGVEAILNQTNFNAKKALEAGIADKIIPAEADLLAEAKAYTRALISGDEALKREAPDFSGIKEEMDKIRKAHLKRARGRMLPAPAAVMKVVEEGVSLPLKEQLELERREFSKTAVSPETQGSIHTFFLVSSSSAKKMLPKGFKPKEIRKAGVLGFGTMGRGIVIEALKYMDIPVVVKDVEAALEPGKEFIKKIIGGDIEKGRFKGDLDAIMQKLITVTDYYAFADVDIVVEAIFEDSAVKAEVYGQLCKALPEDALVVSNTSFLSINELQKSVVNPQRFGGMHFFSPVWRMQLVEIVKGAGTSSETVNNLLAFAGAIRKKPIICKDSPGFVVNAVLDPLMTNGLALAEQGNSIEKIDGAMLSFGMPVGPIRLADEVGLDVSYHIFKERGIEQKTYENLYNAGRYGTKKCGKGLFLADGSVDPEAMQYIAKREEKILSAEEIVSYFITEMVKVGGKLLEDGVIEDPRFIDIGLIWGAGFPADKGGPMKWADLSGISMKLFGKKFYG